MLVRFLVLYNFGLIGTGQALPQNSAEQITRPVISEETCPLELIQPVARDGHRGLGFVRKPPGSGPFPTMILIHGGMVTRPPEMLKEHALNAPNPSRLLAAGYAVIFITYRSRDHDPQSKLPLEDCLAAVDYARRLSYVDPGSIVLYGCSGGGDLALEVAAAMTKVCAIVAEEPASFMFAGIFNAQFPKKGERYTPDDSQPIGDNPRAYYTPEYQKLTRKKIARIQSPILILQGDQEPRVIPFNNQVFIPELRAMGKKVEVISYVGETHCFAFSGIGNRQARRPASALKAFHDLDEFCRRYLKTKPKPIDPGLVKPAPLVTS